VPIVQKGNPWQFSCSADADSLWQPLHVQQSNMQEAEVDRRRAATANKVAGRNIFVFEFENNMVWLDFVSFDAVQRP